MTDEDFMRSALACAAEGVGRTGDNPVVGCAIVKDGVALAVFRTADGGRPHAEEQALSAAGAAARGAAAYVTLEPCAQRSNGGASCSDLLIAAGVARVVIAARDPHPFASGAGVARMRDAGLIVESDVLSAEARAQNAAFFARWDKN